MNIGTEKEFSRRITAVDLPDGESDFTISADSGERATLARRLGISAVDSLEAQLLLTASPGGRLVHIQGRLKADVSQACVLTLVPVRQQIEVEFERSYSSKPEPDDDAEVVSWRAEDWVEPIEHGSIDLGRVVLEQLALEVNLYPRAPGARFEGFSSESKGDEGGPGPFAALAKLKPKR